MTDATILIVTSAITGTVTGVVASIPAIITAMRIAKVKEIVDGPLTLALKENAEIKARFAKLTNAPEDHRAAARAEILCENREHGKQMPPDKS